MKKKKRTQKDQNDQAKIFYMNLNVKLIKETKKRHISTGKYVVAVVVDVIARLSIALVV